MAIQGKGFALKKAKDEGRAEMITTEVYIGAAENFMEEMKTPESAKDKRPVYRIHNEKYIR